MSLVAWASAAVRANPRGAQARRFARRLSISPDLGPVAFSLFVVLVAGACAAFGAGPRLGGARPCPKGKKLLQPGAAAPPNKEKTQKLLGRLEDFLFSFVFGVFGSWACGAFPGRPL